MLKEKEAKANAQILELVSKLTLHVQATHL